VAAHLTQQYLERELRKSRDRLDKELAGAARMQQLLQPPVMPPHPSISFGSFYQTSRHAGGDYYDVLTLGDDRFGILVADVSGHGAPAAIVMAMIRAVVHTYPGVADDPPAVLHYINRHFEFLWETPMYATATYAVVDGRRRTVKLASAGHPLPLIASCDGRVTSPSTDTTMCLLWNELKDIPCQEHPIAKGDRWIFFTDGITDRQAADGTMFDMERLSSAASRHSQRAPSEIVSAIVQELDQFSGLQEPEDDQTLLVVGFA
jgi:sigma-B regulation protein RsbU (phosphoserine phosphatase)